MSSEDVLLEEAVGDGITKFTLNRPDRLNALDKRLLRQIASSIREADDADVLIFTGAGTSFTSGADLNEAQEEGEDGELFQELTRATQSFEGLVIGALHGWVVGGGFEWTLSFDLRYAADDTTFKMTESEVGLPISNASTLLLPLVVGRGRAQEMIYTSREVAAEEAAEWGLVNEVFERDDLEREVLAVAEDIVENKSQDALRTNKRGLNAAFPVETVLEYESLLGDLVGSGDEQIDW